MASKLLNKLRCFYITSPHFVLRNPNFALIRARPFTYITRNDGGAESNRSANTAALAAAPAPTKTSAASTSSLNEVELAKFSAIADSWWDAEGPFKPLHVMNPTRLAFIRSTLCRHFRKDPLSPRPFEGLKFVDVGCGGGILSEPLARMGATVTGVDAVEKNIKIARLHADLDPVASSIEYLCTTAEQLVEERREFDAVIALEEMMWVGAVASGSTTSYTISARTHEQAQKPRMVVQRALLPINALRRRSLVHRESLLRHVRPQAQSEKKEETSAAAAPDNMILFHSSGLTCNQWRKLKNLWHPGRTLFRPQPSSPSPTSSGTGENGKRTKPFFDNLAHSAGPTCILYSAQEKLNNLPDPTDQDLLMLYGEHQSTLVDHMDVEKATSIDGSDDSSVFHSYLPGLHLQLVLDLSCGGGPLQSQGDGSP